MNNTKTLLDYLNLIPQQHRDKPKYVATVSITAVNMVHLQEVVAGFPANFDVDIAIGVQLDAVGIWVGVSRKINVAIRGVYFSWDTIVSEGWDNGVWKKKGDPDNTIFVLDDDEYRALIKSRILSNNWDGSIEQAYVILTTAFVSTPAVTIIDNQDMTMTVNIPQTLTEVQIAMITNEYIVIKPSGIRAIYNIV